MKTRNKILIGVGIVVLLVVGFYVFFPFYVVGPPVPLFSIENIDISNHEVVIEIFDLHNKSIFKETLELGPKEEICYPRPVLLNFRWLKECTLKVTVDNKATKTYKTEVYAWTQFCISLVKDPISGEIRIGISAMVV
ncbi:hypothetical protein C5S39_03310 [Candidatus Methanophagaceae archaeon]|jgi:hypothetical protein|nr:hypothetical protein C5S39_03310 [Methanophagales archaeon]